MLLVMIIAGCNQKTEKIPVTDENLVDVLTRYGVENKERTVLIETEYGNIKLRLYDDTPLHTANFIKLIKEGYYEEAEFYRIFYQFMIQAGKHPMELGYTIPAEFRKNHIHKKGALSMARADENNPELRSSASEFFIVQGSTYTDYQVENEEANNGLSLTEEQKQIYMNEGGYMSLDQQYTVFGEVIEGLDVVDKIAGVKVYSQDKPLKKIPIRILLENSSSK